MRDENATIADYQALKREETIAKKRKEIEEDAAHHYFDRLGLGVDFTARDLQAVMKKKGLPWEVAKAFDSSAPVSELLPVTGYTNLKQLSFRLDRNGSTVQEGNTSLMIFSIEKIIAYVSRFITLKEGDLIFTGTPAGVGPVQPGDHLEAYLEGDKLLDFHVK